MTNYTEWTDSQKPALNLLRKLGWQYIAPQQTEREHRQIVQCTTGRHPGKATTHLKRI